MFRKKSHAHSGKSFDVMEHGKIHTIKWDSSKGCWRQYTITSTGIGGGVQDINESIARFYFLMAWSHVDKRVAQDNCDKFFATNDGQLL